MLTIVRNIFLGVQAEVFHGVFRCVAFRSSSGSLRSFRLPFQAAKLKIICVQIFALKDFNVVTTIFLKIPSAKIFNHGLLKFFHSKAQTTMYICVLCGLSVRLFRNFRSAKSPDFAVSMRKVS